MTDPYLQALDYVAAELTRLQQRGPDLPAFHRGQILERVAEAVQPDGSLDDVCWYLNWSIGEAEATLDGEFTAVELRAIADQMEQAGR